MNTPFANMQASATEMMAGAQKLAQLNLETAKTAFAEMTQTAQAMMAAKSPQEFATLCAAEFKAAPEKATAYGRHVRDIFTQSSQG